MHIGQGYRAGFHALYTNPESISSQYVVYKDGSVEQWVEETDAAYHAGRVMAPSWPIGSRNPNRLFIGIEHEGFTGEQWTEEMVLADLWLLTGIGERHGITWTRNTLLGHYELDSITRRNCPGTGAPLDWMVSDLALPM